MDSRFCLYDGPLVSAIEVEDDMVVEDTVTSWANGCGMIGSTTVSSDTL